MRVDMMMIFFNDTATTGIYTLSLRDAPSDLASTSWRTAPPRRRAPSAATSWRASSDARTGPSCCRSEEHTSELQSRQYLVCRLLLAKITLSCISRSRSYYLSSDLPHRPFLLF